MVDDVIPNWDSLIQSQLLIQVLSLFAVSMNLAVSISSAGFDATNN